jgi:hypothetical protein
MSTFSQAIKGKPGFNESSKKRLKSISEQKIRTTMIGAIHAVELIFGHHFGYQNGKEIIPESELTEEQKFNREKFKEFRAKMLDLGNRQIANIHTELELYDIVFNGYHIEFKVVQTENSGKDFKERD